MYVKTPKSITLRVYTHSNWDLGVLDDFTQDFFHFPRYVNRHIM